MQFNKETFCPYITDKSTPIRKYLHCSKLNDLCKMVTYSPNGQMIPIKDVKNLGCPYGYVIQGIEEKEEEVTLKSDVLDDISMIKVQKSNPKPQQKATIKKTNNPNKKKKSKKKL